MIDLVPVRRALLSVSDKKDLVPFARALHESGVELISTGGTARTIAEAGLPVRTVESVTGFPEMMDGRVKSLHPSIHGGVLARRDNDSHIAAMLEHDIEPIDIVCVNLYPFEKTIQIDGVSDPEVIEQIDIGGPAMLRSAAKNHDFVTVVTHSSQYDRLIGEIRTNEGCTTRALRMEFAATAFSRTAEYDAAISGWMGRRAEERFPDVLELSFIASRSLRYGENPHQKAALYSDPVPTGAGIASAEQIQGKPLSYNNILDASAALELVQDLRDVRPDMISACVLKHTNACGAATGADATTAFSKAHAGDPLAAYGGIVAVSGVIDETAAARMTEECSFLEVVVAERFEPSAAELLGTRWKNVRLLATGELRRPTRPEIMYRSIPGGLLAQEQDRHLPCATDFRHAAGPPPSAEMSRDAELLATVAKHLKSNAVCIGRGGALLGAGNGQVDRVAACRNAIEKAGDRLGPEGPIPVAAGDAFFPFPDGPELLIDAGVGCIVHPGGSKRDAETFDLCAQKGVTCLLSGVRHFRH